MNFAFLLRSKAVCSLQYWAYRFLSVHTVSHPSVACGVINRSAIPSARRAATPITQSCSQVRRPLRVVRIVETGQPRAHVGRMVISGRMADVCAELDRLAAREAAENCGPSRVAANAC